MTTRHEDLVDLLEGYALEALEPGEARTVEEHLATCTSCRERLAEHRQVLVGLPAAIGSASPLRLHPAVKRNVLRALDPLTPRQRWHRPSGSAVAALAAAAVAAVSLFWNWQLSIQLAHQRTVQAEFVGRITHNQATVFDVVDSPATTKRVLRSVADSGPSAPYGKVFSRSDSADVVAMVNRLPQPPAGQQYQLYLYRTDGAISAAGSLPVDSEGFSYLVFRCDRAGPTFDHIEVRLGSQVILAWDGSR